MRCVGVHTFAGGFTMGVRTVHGTEVLCSKEPLDFGTQTLEHRLGLTVDRRPMDQWEPIRNVDFVYGNPRCGGFSCVNMYDGPSRGAGCYQSQDIKDVIRYGCVVLRAPIVAFESVQALPRSAKNRPLLDELIRDYIVPGGYRVAHLFHCAATFGNAQRCRKRYFFVAYKKSLKFGLVPFEVPKVQTTVGDAIDGVGGNWRPRKMRFTNETEYDPGCHMQLPADLENMYQYLEEGWCFNHLLHAHGKQFFKRVNPRVYEKLKFLKSVVPLGLAGVDYAGSRLKWNGPAPALMKGCMGLIHPKRDRTLTVGEVAALMGWPANLIPAGPSPFAQIAKGIVPACGRYLTKCVKATLQGKFSEEGEYRYNKKTNEVEFHPISGRPLEMTHDITAAVAPCSESVWASMRELKYYPQHAEEVRVNRGRV